jgi:cysteine desulfurase
MKRIYLDHAATTPIDKEVIEKINWCFQNIYGNPSSIYESGRIAKKILEESRSSIAKSIGANPGEIIFTGSGTESDNLAILGVARANSKYGKHIIVSTIEHKAVLESAKELEKEGFIISFAPVDRFGIVDVRKLFELIRLDTILISVMLVNNELGTIQPVAEISKKIAKLKQKNNIQNCFPVFHTDACQAVGKIDVDVKKLGVDLLTFNGSKIYGPKGVGVLYKKKSVEISPLIVGGGQENDLRAGTECVPLVAGLALATQKIIKEKNNENKRLIYLRDFFISGLKKRIENIIVNGHQTLIIPNIVHVTIPEVEGESIVLMLDEKGIEVATGSACSARDLHPSHVLVAIGQNENIIHGSIRFSFGKNTSKKELEKVLEVFPKIVDKLKKLSCCKIYEKNKK